ncbi:MAG: GH32 C-terminal domain-containing protein [Candidatus Cryptobacteroides sp.]|nr:GH32 C-terminal domain-containing protein [Candidatus Cryptobacteroides sp.]
MAFLSSRLTAGFDFFDKQTKDMLYEPAYAAVLGEGGYSFQNVAAMSNRGFEFTIGWRDSVKDFHYDISFNGSFNKNRITQLPEEVYYTWGCGNGDNISNVGYALGSWFGYQTHGVFRTQAEVDGMNDPNGMFYLDGEWHLYYQWGPYGSMWNNMTWAHSVSRDLIHWEHRPEVLKPDALGSIFSGSCVVDHNNTAGFGAGAVIALYTSAAEVQTQSLAYSTDGGNTFIKYEGNPILTADIADFRDPNMFWNDEIGKWNLILACGQEMRIYTSDNLIEWTEESRFGKSYGNHEGVWECPDLFKLPVEGTDQQKWVLICNINPGGPNGGSATQYFIGDFDGKKFTVDNVDRYIDGKALWQDYGKDHYAAVSFSNAPDGRHTMIAWMSNWEYANVVPTMQYRSANTIAREPFLYQVDGEIFLGSRPSPEYDGAGLDQTVKVKGSCQILLANQAGEQFAINYDQQTMTLSCDRSRSGQIDFSPHFNEVATAPVHRKLSSIRIFIDNSSIEVFGNNGEVCLTSLVFPFSPLSELIVNKR